jgi:DNA topoisomerase-3
MGRAIAEALGIKGSGQEAIRDKDTIISWCVGHLIETADPESYGEEYKRWAWSSLPILPDQFKFDVVPATKDQYKVLKGFIDSAEVTEIVNACDSGREGQLICNLVLAQAKNKKPVVRLWTSSLTPDAIKKAWKDMKPDKNYSGLLDAARCRQESDWLVGMNASRAQTLYMRATNPALRGEKTVYSIGRVQTPTLCLLWQRDREIATFKPKDFWTVIATYQPPTGTYDGKWFTKKEGKEVDRLDTQEEAKAVMDRVSGKSGVIVSCTQKEERKPPERLYDLTTLQVECNRRFGMTLEETLQVAQALYEAKVTSYPRTNSRHLTDDVAAELPGILKRVAAIPVHKDSIANANLGKKLSKNYVDASKVEDHHAIIPTGEIPSSITAEQRQVYDLIVRRTVAVYHPDQVSDKSEIITEVKSAGFTDQFKTTGKIVREAGWTLVDPPGKMPEDDKPKEGDDDRNLPKVAKGETVPVANVVTKTGKTTPPKPYTEGDLVRGMETAGKSLDDEEMREAMKDSGLGTPATRANIIETLLKRRYIERKKKIMVITPLGISLIEGIPFDVLKSPEMTGEWEAKLAKMARGGFDRARFMSDIRDFVRKIVNDMRQRCGGNAMENEVSVKCPKCDGDVNIRQWDDGNCSANCRTCSVTWTTDNGGVPVGECERCSNPIKVTKTGKKVCEFCGTWQGDAAGGSGGATRERPVLFDPCPKCGTDAIELIAIPGKDAFAGHRDKEIAKTCRPFIKLKDDNTPDMADAPCKECGKPFVNNGKFGPQCIACGAYQQPKGQGVPASGGRQRPVLMESCPKCGKGKIELVSPTGKPPFGACSQGKDICPTYVSLKSDGKPDMAKTACVKCKKKMVNNTIYGPRCLACGTKQPTPVKK